ncbi:MAG: iron-only hydrogenase system regulator [[Clostridium] spiroforme]|uniref:Iron-only hydrogenase system regulator n=1 Tax=Thomasclavelia spiroformis TaxID=29348 RepID=A0A943EGE8_9FIRM|nr:TM1266 family iron-only hydrogenase system putative regulator [Thomasclavelia spiroformis]MBS5587188.1 iron-only hydrogenase system regulator [Thomasclavelia spiroformis]
MKSRLAIIGIFVYEIVNVEKINNLLHEYNQYIIGRMGVPYKDKQVSVISIIVDGPNDIIGALSGKLGMVEGVSVKALYSKRENE